MIVYLGRLVLQDSSKFNIIQKVIYIELDAITDIM